MTDKTLQQDKLICSWLKQIDNVIPINYGDDYRNQASSI